LFCFFVYIDFSHLSASVLSPGQALSFLLPSLNFTISFLTTERLSFRQTSDG